MTSSEQHISSEALINFRYYHFVRHWGKIVVFLIYKHIFIDGQSRNIREILESSGICFTPKKKCPFNDQEIRNLSLQPEDLDITLITKICRLLWEKGISDPGDSLKDLVKKIKDARNIVCHEERQMSQTELENKLLDFKTTLEETLDEVKSRFGFDGAIIDGLKSKIRVAVPKMLEKIREKYDPLDPADVQKLQDEIKDFWNQLFEYIQQLTQEELKSGYERPSRICLYEWLAQYGVVDPCGITVSLMIDQEKEFHEGIQSHECITVDQKEILEIKDQDGNDPEAIIVSGDSGSGKTTMLCSILEMWCKDSDDMPGLSSFNTLLNIQFRVHRYNNFNDYLKSLLPKTVSLFGLELVKSSIINSKCLILCDGFDEANENSLRLFKEVLSLGFKDTKIVITSRPGNTKVLTEMVNKAHFNRLNFTILGLRKEDRETLIGNITAYILKNDETKVKEMKRNLSKTLSGMDERMLVIMETPLYFNMFILLYIVNPNLREKVRSVATLFIELQNEKRKRLKEKTGIQSRSLKEFDDIYLEQSVKHYKEKKYVLSEEDIMDMKKMLTCREAAEKFDCIASEYFTVKNNIMGTDIRKTYCYRHASELEFAAASKICKDISSTSKVKEVLSGNGLWDMWRPFLGCVNAEKTGVLLIKQENVEEVVSLFVFIVGILNSCGGNVLNNVTSGISNALLELVDIDTFISIWADYIETGLDPKVFKSLVSILERTSAKNELCIKGTRSLSALPQVLKRLRPKRIDIIYRKICRGYFPSLLRTLDTASRFSIFVFVNLNIDLKNHADFSGGSTSRTVDKLDLTIWDFKDDDLSQLSQFPVSAIDQRITYNGNRKNVQDISNIINAVWPRDEERDLEGGLCTNHSTFFPTEEPRFQSEHPSLVIGLHKRVVGEEDIKLLLESLDVQPLRELYLRNCSVTSNTIREELRSVCMEKGLGDLKGVSTHEGLCEAAKDIRLNSLSLLKRGCEKWYSDVTRSGPRSITSASRSFSNRMSN